MSRHDSRQTLARELGATDIVTQRGDDGVARIKDGTGPFVTTPGPENSLFYANEIGGPFKKSSRSRRS